MYAVLGMLWVLVGPDVRLELRCVRGGATLDDVKHRRGSGCFDATG